MSIYHNQNHMEKKKNIHFFVNKTNFFYDVTFIIDKINKSFKNSTITFVASNEYGFDKAVLLINFLNGY